MIITLDELGEISEKKGKTKVAIDYYKQMIPPLVELEKHDVLKKVKTHLVELYTKIGKKELAEKLQEELDR